MLSLFFPLNLKLFSLVLVLLTSLFSFCSLSAEAQVYMCTALVEDFVVLFATKLNGTKANLILCDPPWGVLNEPHDTFSDHVFRGLQRFASRHLLPDGVLLLSTPWQQLHTWTLLFSGSDWHIHKSLLISVLTPPPPQLNFSYTPKEICTFWLLITRSATNFFTNFTRSTVPENIRFANVLYFPAVSLASLLKVLFAPLLLNFFSS